MLRVQMLEVAANYARRELFDDVLETAFSERENLVSTGCGFNWLCDELDRRAPVDRQQVDQCLQRDALSGLEPSELARALLVVGPGNLDIGSQRGQQDVDEVGR